MGRKISCSLIAFFVLFVFFSYKELQAAVPYYEGKRITIIVGSEPGERV